MTCLPLLVVLLASSGVHADPPNRSKTWDGCMALKEKHRPLGKSLSEALGRAGIDVIRIADSKKNGFFQNWREACWVETNLGILDVIFFPEGAGGKRLRIERLEAEYGLARSRVISPDGQTVTVQGLETHDFTGPRTWISTASKELAEALNRVRDFP